MDRSKRFRAIQAQLATLRAEYHALHKEAKAATAAKDYDRLLAASAREYTVITKYCSLVEQMMKLVEVRATRKGISR